MTTSNAFLRDDAQFVGASSGGPRYVLTTATSFYFDTAAGSDTTGDGSNGTPWQSPAPLGRLLDFGSQTVTLNQKNNATAAVAIPALVGGGTLILDLNSHSIALASGTCVSTPIGVPIATAIKVQNGTLSSVTGDAIDAFHIGGFEVGTGMTFGTCGGTHINAVSCLVKVFSNYSVSGAAGRHWRAQNLSTISTGVFSPVIDNTSGGALNFPLFCFADGGSQVLTFATFPAAHWSTSTGQRYLADGNAVIVTHAGPNYFPGNAAGTTSNGGQYI